MMMNSNMEVVNNFTELDSSNPSVQDLLVSLTNHVGFSDHHQRSQIPFTFSNNTSHYPNSSHQHHLQVPLNFESVSHDFFPQGGDRIGHGCNNINSISEPNYLANSSSTRISGTAGVLVNNKANGSYDVVLPSSRPFLFQLMFLMLTFSLDFLY